MNAKVILFIAFLFPRLSLFFISSKTIKRFMPVTIFTCLLMTIIFEIAYTYKWWVIHQYIVPWGYMIDVSFGYGIFTVGTFWIFRLASHKFVLYTRLISSWMPLCVTWLFHYCHDLELRIIIRFLRGNTSLSSMVSPLSFTDIIDGRKRYFTMMNKEVSRAFPGSLLYLLTILIK
jgi:hypothetical protein